MDSLLEAFTEYWKDKLIDGIMHTIGQVFIGMNNQVGTIADNVGQTPSEFMPEVFTLIKTLSENVIMPIAGIILTFIACYELIQMVLSHNNLSNFETWIFFKWIIKTFIAVELITHTFDFTMAIFDVAQHVVQQSAGIITQETEIRMTEAWQFRDALESLDVMELFGIYLQCNIVRTAAYILSLLIFVIINGRMIQIYLMVSLAPIPFATFGNKEQSLMGQNYVRSLFALGFQGFLIMVCVGIYAVLVQNVALASADDIAGSLWTLLGYTVLLAYTLFKTDDVARSVLHAH